MDLDDLYRLLRNAHLQAQGVMDTIRDPLLVLDSGLCVLAASQSFYDTFEVSKHETIGQPFHKLGNGQWDIEDLHFLLEKVIPRSASVDDYEVRADFPGLGRRSMLVTARRLIHPDSNNRVILLSMTDATDRPRTYEEQEVVIGELRHRIKNILSVVVSLARQTEAAGRSGEAYRDAFLGRVEALLRANGFAMDSEGSVQLSDLIRATLEPYSAGAARIEMEPSPDVSLAPAQVVPLSLILHELATNALKYGSLSGPEGGRLRVGWSLENRNGNGGDLRIGWSETGGPPVSPPERSGFGTRLIDVAVKRDLGGRVERTFSPGGLFVEVRFPL